ncbi:DUF5076 domain-containing protein [Sphingomonas sp.]|jgi:hypothetical protein|uniref:DUF5076 domain-containing protein n=1 Tax=Sphingomonas sp. TaxID=28214 RepID=UPI002E343FBB|nr:DUF5076 domain-containing protein [Sphingomonas sp.]HEX4694849.1 DUF5076 domain-containing protein [Sphingomonas sp.]
MTDKPVPIDLVPYSDMLAGSREFLRMWAKREGQAVCFVNPAALNPDPATFGVALVDAVRHGARAWAQAVGVTEQEALERIWFGVDAERNNPTDLGKEVN